ncbi:thyrotropin-releasing hormone receptor-like [Anneissia japonica]|uniref:thyrotropin-releasing hormone receptor-like n=1 Tax=Anneissia japonica TaxID=1529436 RepID=UPI0014258614|nr:thyrotropin-releasing hormone receptor-like [Anneissia japonica]
MENLNETDFLDYCAENNWTLMNLSTPSAAERLIYTDADFVITAIIMPILLVLGWITNGAFLFVVYRVKYMHTITNLYLVNLSISDVVFLSFAIGDKLWRYATSDVYMDNVAKEFVDICMMYLFKNIAYFTGQFLISLVALDRYNAVCRPLQQYKVNSLTRAVSLIVSTWCFALVLAASMTPGYMDRKTKCILWPDDEMYDHYPDTYVYFAPISNAAKVYAEIIQTVPFFINMIFETVLYVLIICTLHSRVTSRVSNGITGGKLTEIRNQVTRMLIINGVVYILLSSPFQVYSLMSVLSTFRDPKLSRPQLNLFLHIARVLVYTNSVVNPIIYNLSSHRYRKAFVRAFSCKGSKSSWASFCMTDTTRRQRAGTTATTTSTTSSTIVKSVTRKTKMKPNSLIGNGESTYL